MRRALRNTQPGRRHSIPVTIFCRDANRLQAQCNAPTPQPRRRRTSVGLLAAVPVADVPSAIAAVVAERSRAAIRRAGRRRALPVQTPARETIAVDGARRALIAVRRA